MSKRLNLREFQQNLIDRLQVTGLPESRASMLAILIAGKNWLVDMADIAEVLPLPSLTAVPLTKSWFLGVANVRGNLYGVIDMATYEKTGAASGNANNCVLLVSERFAFNAALLVDRVLGLRDTQSWKRNEVYGQAEYLDETGASWTRLDVQGLLQQAEFLQIGI